MCSPVLLPAPSASFVYLAAVADMVEINSSKFHIKFVKHPVVTNAQFEFRPALQPLVRKNFQTRAHFINLALHGFTDGGGQIVERF